MPLYSPSLTAVVGSFYSVFHNPLGSYNPLDSLHPPDSWTHPGDINCSFSHYSVLINSLPAERAVTGHGSCKQGPGLPLSGMWAKSTRARNFLSPSHGGGHCASRLWSTALPVEWHCLQPPEPPDQRLLQSYPCVACLGIPAASYLSYQLQPAS